MSPRDLLHTTVAGVAALAFPPSCLVCDADLRQTGGHFCPTCMAELVRDDALTCPRCSSPIGPHVDAADGCLRCRHERFRFDSAVRLGPYAGVLRDAILRMKHAGAEALAGRVGELWAATRRERLSAGDPQVIIPVPLHWRRRWSRGYNQSDELALGVARALGLPCRRGVLKRTAHTPKQSQTGSAAERKANLAGRFRARARLPGARVLLIDDVLTTGATADAAAVAILDAGAAQVRVAVLAHLAS